MSETDAYVTAAALVAEWDTDEIVNHVAITAMNAQRNEQVIAGLKAGTETLLQQIVKRDAIIDELRLSMRHMALLLARTHGFTHFDKNKRIMSVVADLLTLAEAPDQNPAIEEIPF